MPRKFLDCAVGRGFSSLLRVGSSLVSGVSSGVVGSTTWMGVLVSESASAMWKVRVTESEA